MTRDKLYHLAAGATIAAGFGLYFEPAIGVLMAMVAGVAKEVWDLVGSGSPEAGDIVATVAGGLIVYGVLICA